METLAAFLIGFVVTFYFVRGYLKSLTRQRKDVPAEARAVKMEPCPRCGKPIPQGSAFCAACGAALSLWNVHRSEVKTGGDGDQPKGKPRPVINATLCIGCGSCIDACPETGALALAGGKAILAQPDACTGHAKCVSACPTSAITLAFGNVRQTLRVPLVRENFETNVDGLFIVGELGGMGLIKTAINEGRLVMDHVRRRLESMEGWAPIAIDGHGHAAELFDEPKQGLFDVAIVGAGPAGLSASLSAQQHGLRYLALEQGEIASTIKQYPRHKFLMAEPVEMPLYGSLYVGDGTKESLLAIWETIIANTRVRIRTNERVTEIRRGDPAESFVVQSPNGAYYTRNVVLAIGKRGSPRKLGVPGEDLAKVAYRLIEADNYENGDIVVVGGGDSAIEAALALSKAGQNRVSLSHRGKDFSRARERNRSMLAERESQGHLRVLLGSQVKEILPKTIRIDCGGELQEMPNDFAFILIGGDSPEDFLRKTGVEIVEKLVCA